MNTRTITGTIVRPSGAAWNAATLTFKLRARFVVGSDTVLPDRVTATTDSDGAFSVRGHGGAAQCLHQRADGDAHGSPRTHRAPSAHHARTRSIAHSL